MTETVEFHNTEFTFERVDSINELPQKYQHVAAESHEEALTFYEEGENTHIFYFTAKPLRGKSVNVYAFTKGE